MRKLLGIALLAGLLWPAAAVEGRGGRSHGCAPACDTGCYGGDSGCNVAWVDQVMTGYRAEMRTRVVPTQVTRMVAETVAETVKYTEMVQVVTPQKRTETYWTCVTKQVPYTYTVNVPVWTPQTTTQTYYTCVAKQVPYTYTVNVPVWTPQTTTQTYYTCVPEHVVVQVPVCRMVSCQVMDPCTGCCHTTCRPVMEYQAVTKTVMRQVAQSREVTVNVCSWKAEQRQAVSTVYENVAQTREVTVNVCSWKAEERTATRVVSEMVAQSREVTVNVVSHQAVEKTATVNRVAWKPVTETVNVTQCYSEMVPYTYTIKVAVPVAAPVAAPCAPGCGH